MKIIIVILITIFLVASSCDSLKHDYKPDEHFDHQITVHSNVQLSDLKSEIEETFGIDLQDRFEKQRLHELDESHLTQEIAILESILSSAHIGTGNNDHRLYYYIYSRLAALYEHTENPKPSLSYLNKAISMIEDDPEMRAWFAYEKMILAGAYSYHNDYDKAFSLYRDLIENFRHVEIGPDEEWFATQQVGALHNMVRRIEDEEIKSNYSKKLLTYYQMLAEAEEPIATASRIHTLALKLQNTDVLTDQESWIPLSDEISVRVERSDKNYIKNMWRSMSSRLDQIQEQQL